MVECFRSSFCEALNPFDQIIFPTADLSIINEWLGMWKSKCWVGSDIYISNDFKLDCNQFVISLTFNVDIYDLFFQVKEYVVLSLWSIIIQGMEVINKTSVVIELLGRHVVFFDKHFSLTHWGRVTHICVGNLTINGADNGLSPGRRQAIIRTNAGILLIEPLRTNFSEVSIEIHTFSFKKMHLKVSSAKWRPFCLGLNVLI